MRRFLKPGVLGRRLRRAGLVLCLAAAGGAAAAQVLRPGGLVGDLGRTAGGVLNQVQQDAHGLITTADQALQSPADLLDARQLRLRWEAARYPRLIELDENGQPATRGRILALGLSEAELSQAAGAGFTVERTTPLGDGQSLVALRTPSGLSAREGLKRLRRLNPAGRYDYDHLYEPSGAVSAAGGVAALAAPKAQGLVVGMVDGGVDAGHPVFAHARIVLQGFAPGAPRPSAHGTAVASLLVGEGPRLRAAAAGAELLAADVYGAAPAGGSVDAIVRALLWLEARRARVVNISLVGPPNLILQAVVARMVAAGEVLVAPVGNDGPAAPPAYPAAYPGVVAASPVDGRQHPLFEAGRAPKPAFSAPGADMAAAALGGGFAPVRGSSFAAPLVAARIAAALAEVGDVRLALQRVQTEALHPPGAEGLGLVGWNDRTPAGPGRP